MFEAIPVSTRKRRDLKPGTVFQYKWKKKESGEEYLSEKYVVDKEPSEPHTDAAISLTHWQSDTTLNSDVVAIWEPLPEETKPANPKQQYGDKKPPLHLVPPAFVVATAKGLGEGAGKYGAWNWRNTSVEAMTYVGAILRHLAAWVDGEEIDPESTTGKHHLDGAAASLAILIDCLSGGFLIDNRPPKGPGPELVRTPAKK
jgi:hypothetical protein